MIFLIFAVLTAISISITAEYYSILGLMAIFPAAGLQIIIMGIVLGIGKCVSVLWLHYNWHRADWKIKTYLTSAVCALMLITSLGIFGGLSKAHLEQSVPSGDIEAQVQLFDEKIKTQRDDIDTYRRALTQMDGAVDQLMSRTADEHGADKAVALRRSQARERASLQTNIDQSQKKISVLQEQRAPIASQLRRVNADVGPVRYIAALVYGDHPSQDTLEAAVRLVIIIIVLVFDPLAIVLLLASTTSLDWIKEEKQKKVEEIAPVIEHKENVQPIIVDTERAAIVATHQKELKDSVDKERKRYDELLLAVADQNTSEEELTKTTKSLNQITEDFNALVPTMMALEEECAGLVTQDSNLRIQLNTLIKSYDHLLDEKVVLEEKIKQLDAESTLAKEYGTQLEELRLEINEKNTKVEITTLELKQLQSEIEEKNNKLLAVESKLLEHDTFFQEEINNRDITINDLYGALKREVDENNLLRNARLNESELATEKPKLVTEEHVPEIPTIESPTLVATVNDELPMGGNASFGVNFPPHPINGDLFLRVDYMPNKLFKWVGSRWIEIDKSITDAYAFDEQYIKLLVEKVSLGEYDIDDLNHVEQEQVAIYLKNHPK